VRGVERALLDGEAEIGVHSAKDLPARCRGLVIAAVPAREDPADVWIGVGASLDEVPEGARVGTASLRRRASCWPRARPAVSELHGNVDTRLRKLARRARRDRPRRRRPAAAGREDEVASRSRPSDDPGRRPGRAGRCRRAATSEARRGRRGDRDETALRELTAERAVVALLDATCATPIGVHARSTGRDARDRGLRRPPDGSEWIRDRLEGEAERAGAAAGAPAGRRRDSSPRRASILDRAEAMSA
jgi:hydroxymethylbilane synthase